MSNTDTEAREKYPYHRRFVRHRVRVKVKVLNGKSYSTWTINLSEDGLCFEIPAMVAQGKEVAVSVYLSRDSKDAPIEGMCRVVWNDAAKGGKHRHGAQFVRFDTDGEERLRGGLKRI